MMKFLVWVYLSSTGLGSLLNRREDIVDPCTVLSAQSLCLNGLCKDILYVGDLIQDSVFLVDSFELRKIHGMAKRLTCTMAARTDPSGEYLFNGEFFNSRVNELIEITKRDLIPAIKQFPISLQDLHMSLDAINQRNEELIASGLDVLELSFSWKDFGVSSEFLILKEQIQLIQKSLSVSHPYQKRAYSDVLERLLHLPSEFGSPDTSSSSDGLSTVKDFLLVSEFLEGFDDVIQSTHSISEEDMHTLADILGSILSEDPGRGEIAILRHRFEQVVCPISSDILQLMASEPSVDASEISSVFWLCSESLTISQRISFGNLIARASSRSFKRRIESVSFTSDDPKILIHESRAFLGNRDKDTDLMLPLFPNIRGRIINMSKWLKFIAPICNDPDIFSQQPKLMLKPYDNTRSASNKLRACGRLLGLALRNGTGLGLDFDIQFFMLLRIMSPGAINLDPEIFTDGQLAAARIIREGIADIVSHVTVQSLTELELHEAIL